MSNPAAGNSWEMPRLECGMSVRLKRRIARVHAEKRSVLIHSIHSLLTPDFRYRLVSHITAKLMQPRRGLPPRSMSSQTSAVS